MATFAVNVVAGYTIQDGEILTPDILRQIALPTVDIVGTISSASIADGSITNPKLAAASVASGNLIDGSVITSKLADLNVTAAKIANNTITAAQIANSTITATQMADATITQAKFATGVGTAPVVGSSRNLTVARNAGTPNSKVTATADAIILTAAGPLSFQATTVNVTADVTVGGVNGLDTGVEANSTWYYLFVIYNGTTVSSLLSVSKTAPTMPAGYTYSVLVGAVLNDSGGNFGHVITYGNVTKFVSSQQSCTKGTLVSLAHNLGATPTQVQWVLVCTGGEVNWSVGDEVMCAGIDTVGGLATGFTEAKTSTNLMIIPSDTALDMKNKTTGSEPGTLAYTVNTLTNWKLVCYAVLL